MPNTIEVRNVSKTFRSVKRKLWFQKLPPDEKADPNVRLSSEKKLFWKSRLKETQALRDINLKIKEGEIRGLLGPNGAGKTTLAKIISTLVLPDTGKVVVNGYNVATETVRARFSIGLVTGGERSLYWKLTPLQNLRFFGNLYGMSRSESTRRALDLLSIFGLDSKKNDLVQNLSTGQKMRVAFARGLMHDPEVLVLDEYNRGLDPNVSRQLRDYIKQVLQKENGKTVLLMTHDMNVAEDLCNRITLINNGKIITEGTPNELMRNVGNSQVIEIETSDPLSPELVEVLKTYGEVEVTNGGGVSRTRMVVDNHSEITYEVLTKLNSSGTPVDNLTFKRANLEDVFVHYTGRRLGDD